MASSLPHTLLQIDGTDVDAKQRIEIVNPLKRQVVGTCAAATEKDCIAAVDAAARAFPAWEAVPLAKKRDIFLKTAELLESDAYRSRLMEVQKREMAATPGWSAVGVGGAVNYFRTTAGLASELQGRGWDSDKPGGTVIEKLRAAGVVLSIVPWNSPVVLTARAIAVPLFTGNTVVLKASEYTPTCSLIVCEALWEAGLPKGVLNFIAHTREDAPRLTETMIAHSAVKRITFTGSDVVGSKISVVAGKHLKQCVMELGGKNATVVLEDADLDAAAKAIVFSSNMHSGQVCMATERVIVRDTVADKLTELLKHHISALHSGEGEQLSALFTDAAAENVISHITEAKAASGVEVLLGDGKRDGSVIQPHILRGIGPGMKIWAEETFGPVTAITVAKSDDEALELANDTEYTLIGALWTRDLMKAMDMGSRIRVGTLVVNGPTIHLESGSGNVGLGGRSGYGQFNVAAFTDTRKIVILPPGGSYPLTQSAANGAAH